MTTFHLYDFIAQLAVLVSPLVAVHRLVQKEAKNKRNSMTTHLSDSKTIFRDRCTWTWSSFLSFVRSRFMKPWYLRLRNLRDFFLKKSIRIRKRMTLGKISTFFFTSELRRLCRQRRSPRSIPTICKKIQNRIQVC